MLVYKSLKFQSEDVELLAALLLPLYHSGKFAAAPGILRREIADLNVLWHKAQTAGKCAFPCNILRMCSIIKGYSQELALEPVLCDRK